MIIFGLPNRVKLPEEAVVLDPVACRMTLRKFNTVQRDYRIERIKLLLGTAFGRKIETEVILQDPYSSVQHQPVTCFGGPAHLFQYLGVALTPRNYCALTARLINVAHKSEPDLRKSLLQELAQSRLMPDEATLQVWERRTTHASGKKLLMYEFGLTDFRFSTNRGQDHAVASAPVFRQEILKHGLLPVGLLEAVVLNYINQEVIGQIETQSAPGFSYLGTVVAESDDTPRCFRTGKGKVEYGLFPGNQPCDNCHPLVLQIAKIHS